MNTFIHQKHRLTVESSIYLLALLLALFLRVNQLGHLPLNDLEANQALDALRITHGSISSINSGTAYLIPTAFLFSIFEPNDNLARLIPALIGSMFILTPVLFKKIIGHNTALVLAIALVIDPGLIYASRHAGTDMIALAAIFGALGMIVNRRWIFAGILVTIGLLSGSPFWIGTLILVVGGFWVWLPKRNRESYSKIISFGIEKHEWFANWKKIGFGACLTVLILGTGLLLVPSAISGFGTGLYEFISRWFSAENSIVTPISIFLAFLGILIYYPLALVFASINLFEQFRETPSISLLLVKLIVVAFIVATIWPSRYLMGYLWGTILIWIIASKQIAKLLMEKSENPLMGWTTTLLQMVLIIFGQLHILGYLANPMEVDNVNGQLHIAAILGTVIIIFILTILVGWGWSWKIAWLASKRTMLIAGVIYCFVLLQKVSGFSAYPEAEIWNSVPFPSEARLMVQTIESLSLQTTGYSDQIDIDVVGLDSPSLEWSLIRFARVNFTPVLSVNAEPSILLTSSQNAPELPTGYRGQDFVWGSTPSWQLVVGAEWLDWFYYREIIREQTDLLLWARNDLFPNANSSSLVDDTSHLQRH